MAKHDKKSEGRAAHLCGILTALTEARFELNQLPPADRCAIDASRHISNLEQATRALYRKVAREAQRNKRITS
jgi:hypothetical protein